MKLITRERSLAAMATALAISFAIQQASAQTPAVPPPPVRYTGEVVSVADDGVSLRDKEGKTITVAMISGWTVVNPHPVSSSALKIGDFVASANTNIDAGSGKSTEVRILEPGYKPEENTHPIGQPNTSMTHGTIMKIDRDASGVKLLVTYPTGSRQLLVSPDVKITGYDVKKRGDLVPGTIATAITRVGPDGIARAARLVLGD